MPHRQLNAFAPEWVPGGLAIPAAQPRAYVSAAPGAELCTQALTSLKVPMVSEAVEQRGKERGAGECGGGAREPAADDAGGGELEFDDVFAPSDAATPTAVRARRSLALLWWGAGRHTAVHARLALSPWQPARRLTRVLRACCLALRSRSCSGAGRGCLHKAARACTGAARIRA